MLLGRTIADYTVRGENWISRVRVRLKLGMNERPGRLAPGTCVQFMSSSCQPRPGRDRNQLKRSLDQVGLVDCGGKHLYIKKSSDQLGEKRM
jgi:hypothetical protein